MNPIVRSQLVWINVPTGGGAAGSTLKFPDVGELVGTYILGIEAFSIVTLAATPDRVAVLSAAESTGVLLSMYEGNVMRHQQIPMAILRPENVGGIVFETFPFVPNWKMSGIEMTAAVTAARSIPFVFWYASIDDMRELFRDQPTVLRALRIAA